MLLYLKLLLYSKAPVTDEVLVQNVKWVIMWSLQQRMHGKVSPSYLFPQTAVCEQGGENAISFNTLNKNQAKNICTAELDSHKQILSSNSMLALVVI